MFTNADKKRLEELKKEGNLNNEELLYLYDKRGL